MSVYDAADKAIRSMNRQKQKAFSLLKLVTFDELKLIRQVEATYEASARTAKKKYLEIGLEAFIAALMETGMPERVARGMAMEEIGPDLVLDMLEESDPVTLYIFTAETERKKERLIEALASAQDKGREVDKALKFWTRQVAQYADNAVFYARLDAFKAIGVKRVRWQTKEDERVCEECGPLNGQIFAVEDAPMPPHWGCRCVLIPLKD